MGFAGSLVATAVGLTDKVQSAAMRRNRHSTLLTNLSIGEGLGVYEQQGGVDRGWAAAGVGGHIGPCPLLLAPRPPAQSTKETVFSLISLIENQQE